MDKNKTYLVLNYCSSPVAVETRTDSYLINGGSTEEPSSMPFSLDEIFQINSNSPVFKTGILRFEKEYEKDIYEEIRIKNWQNIMTDEEIENIILHPTIKSLQKIIDVQSDMYFERIYGIYIGLVNSDFPIRENVKTVMSARRKEFKNNQRISRIVLSKKDESNEGKEIERLNKEIESLKALISQNNITQTDTVNNNTDTTKSEVKQVKRGRPKKNTSNK